MSINPLNVRARQLQHVVSRVEWKKEAVVEKHIDIKNHRIKTKDEIESNLRFYDKVDV